MNILFAGFLLFPGCRADSGVDDIQREKLQAAVTFEARYLPLVDWAATVSRASGQRITVSRQVSQRKISIVCQHRPASEVMRQVAVALGLKWVQGKDGGFRAELDDSVKIAESEADRYEETVRLLRLQKTLKSASDRADLTPEQIRADLARVYNHLQELEREHRPPDDAELLASRDEYRLITTSPLYFQFIAALAAAGPGALEEMAKGQPEFGSSDPTDRTAVLPRAVLSGLSGETSGLAFGFLEQSADGMRLEGKVFRIGNYGISYGRLGTPLPSAEQPTPPRLRQWFKTWSSAQSPSLLAAPVADPERAFQTGRYSNGPYDIAVSSTADQLVDLAKRSGIPVIADAFRRPAYRREQIRCLTVSDWIAAFNRVRVENNIDFTPGFTRLSDGWLMFRHDRYWVKQALEIPEDVITKMASRPKLGLDDYAWMASQLTWLQLAGTRQRALLPFPAEPLSGSGRLLLFWALLTSDQRSAARSEGLVLATLSPEQVRALAIAMLDVQTSDIKDYVEILRHLVRNEPAFGSAFLRLTDSPPGIPGSAGEPLGSHPQFDLGFGDKRVITWRIPIDIP